MAKRIEDLLHRRNDLSTFLVHLTRPNADQDARDNLLDILLAMQIEARTPMGLGADYFEVDAAFAESQKTACFTETPLEYVWMMCEEIENRAVNMQPYGLAFTKTWARRKGVNPVMYVDITRGHDWLTEPVNVMLEAAHAGRAIVKDADEWVPVGLADSPIARLTPFLEPMGKPGLIRREWWWEREWRRVGGVMFQWHDIVAVLVPENDHNSFVTAFDKRRAILKYAPPIRPLRYLDPRWGQERMIAALAEVSVENLGPFPA